MNEMSKISEVAPRFDALKKARLRLKQSTASERAAKITALWKEVCARQDDICEACRLERNSHKLDVAAELMMVKTKAQFVAKHLKKWMKPHRVPNSMATMGKKCEIRYEPKGVVVNLSAWNAQIAECFVPTISAIAAGNAVAIKPSELAPHSAKIVQEIVEAVFEPDEVAVFQGDASVAQELLSQPFDHVYYTGGCAVGALVMKAAADQFASVTLEMGGKSPVIIDETAKIDNAATKLAWGRVMNAGQVCIAPDYVLVHESVAEEFTTKLASEIERLYNSEQKGFEHSSYMPCIINERHHQRIVSLIDDAVEKGAKLAFGGEHNIKSRFIAPTLLSHTTLDMRIMQEEIFGPVLPIMTWRDKSELPSILAKNPNPLAFYAFSTDEDAIEFYLTISSSGSAVVNNVCIQAGTNHHLPFGGVGTSGMGRTGGFDGFKDMSNPRSIIHQPLGRLRDMMIQLPPYSKRYDKIIMSAIKK